MSAGLVVFILYIDGVVCVFDRRTPKWSPVQ